jgi:endoglucanase
VDEGRLVIADGLSWGNDPLPELADLGVGQRCRGYLPMGVSHYQALWVGGEKCPEPSWPCVAGGAERWDKGRLDSRYTGGAALVDRRGGVDCGECGCFNRTSHAVFP